jgi:hypothetical protein
MKDIPAKIRIITELEEKGCQQAADIALGSVLEIKVIERDQCRPCLLHVLDILNNSGACPNINFILQKRVRNHAPQNAFSGTRCKIGKWINRHEDREG